MSFKNVKEKVASMLNRNPLCKDDDYKLCANIWADELSQINNGRGYDWASAHQFLKLYATGKMTSAPSIKRARAKLQEEHPEYRGKKYNDRITRQSDKMKEELGYQWLPYKD